MNSKHLYLFLSILSLQFLVNCSDSNTLTNNLFSQIKSSESGINFINKIENGADMNIFKYRNFYNGGGVAIGDINNDGLSDVYMTSNLC